MRLFKTLLTIRWKDIARRIVQYVFLIVWALQYVFVGIVCLVLLIGGLRLGYHYLYVEPKKEREAFFNEYPDNRLIEIIKLDVAGGTHSEIANYFGVSKATLRARINADRELYDKLKIQYLSRRY